MTHINICEQKKGTKADDSTILSSYHYQLLQKNINMMYVKTC